MRSMSGARVKNLLIVLGLTVLAAACATTAPHSTLGGGGAYKIGVPYEVAGVRYVPREQPNYDETGVASWYGPGFHGHLTADGEIYDQEGLTAAHATLPLPVSVRVTNLENGRSIVVRVNDRGPFHDGRIIDLSARAAELLGFKGRGTARVRVQYLGPANQPDMAIAQNSPPRASPPAHAPAPSVPTDTPVIAMAPIPNPPETASDAAPSPPPPQVEPLPDVQTAASDAPPPAAESNPQTSTLNRAAQIAAAAASLLVSPAEAEPAPSAVKAPTPSGPTHFYVQVGTFSQSANAEALYRDVASLGRAAIVPAATGGKTLYRVRIGPIASREEASGILQDVLTRGHDGAKVVSE